MPYRSHRHPEVCINVYAVSIAPAWVKSTGAI
mgnify:FL=1